MTNFGLLSVLVTVLLVWLKEKNTQEHNLH